jgi:hypothetical protein
MKFRLKKLICNLIKIFELNANKYKERIENLNTNIFLDVLHEYKFHRKTK